MHLWSRSWCREAEWKDRCYSVKFNVTSNIPIATSRPRTIKFNFINGYRWQPARSCLVVGDYMQTIVLNYLLVFFRRVGIDRLFVFFHVRNIPYIRIFLYQYELGKSEFVQTDRIWILKILIIFFPIKNKDRLLYCYINIEHYKFKIVNWFLNIQIFLNIIMNLSIHCPLSIFVPIQNVI